MVMYNQISYSNSNSNKFDYHMLYVIYDIYGIYDKMAQL